MVLRLLGPITEQPTKPSRNPLQPRLATTALTHDDTVTRCDDARFAAGALHAAQVDTSTRASSRDEPQVALGADPETEAELMEAIGEEIETLQEEIRALHKKRRELIAWRRHLLDEQAQR